MALRAGLLKEILFLSLDTLRANKLRSALTILGVVIGVSSVVGMTSLIRGFGDQMTGLVQQMGASTVYVAKLSIASLFSGRNFFDLLKRPDITEADAKAIKELCPSVDLVGIQLGGGPAQQPQRFTYRDKSTKAMQVIGSTANFPETNYLEIAAGTLLLRLRSVAPAPGRRARQRAEPRRCSRTSTRSARKCGLAPTSTR